jgi:3-hydroxybutyryl-CoA dehydratase
VVNDLSFAAIAVGDTAELRKTVSEGDVHAFAGITLDFNPLHLDQAIAARGRFKQRVVHGMLSAGLISAVIGTRLPGANTIYLQQTLKFTAPVFIGDTLAARVEVIEKIERKHILKLKTEVTRQDGTVVVEGIATVMKR